MSARCARPLSASTCRPAASTAAPRVSLRDVVRSSVSAPMRAITFSGSRKSNTYAKYGTRPSKLADAMITVAVMVACGT